MALMRHTAKITRCARSSTRTRRRAAVVPAGREHGQFRACNNRTFDIAKAVPTVVMRNEDYGRRLPVIGISQDPIEYDSHTWHTNLDTYERIIEDDARQSAMVIAAAVYHLAMRDEKLPRIPKDRMPALPTP